MRQVAREDEVSCKDALQLQGRKGGGGGGEAGARGLRTALGSQLAAQRLQRTTAGSACSLAAALRLPTPLPLRPLLPA